MKILFRTLKDKYQTNSLNILPTIQVGSEWISIDFLWIEVLIWERK